MSKPKRMPIGTSGKLLKGRILFNNRSHSSGMKGVITANKSRDRVAILSGVGGGTAEGTPMFAFTAGQSFVTT